MSPNSEAQQALRPSIPPGRVKVGRLGSSEDQTVSLNMALCGCDNDSIQLNTEYKMLFSTITGGD